jgi:hypothetical protein
MASASKALISPKNSGQLDSVIGHGPDASYRSYVKSTGDNIISTDQRKLNKAQTIAGPAGLKSPKNSGQLDSVIGAGPDASYTNFVKQQQLSQKLVQAQQPKQPAQPKPAPVPKQPTQPKAQVPTLPKGQTTTSQPSAPAQPKVSLAHQILGAVTPEWNFAKGMVQQVGQIQDANPISPKNVGNVVKAGAGIVTGNKKATSNAVNNIKNTETAPLKSVGQGTAQFAYGLGESLNPAGGDVNTRSHTAHNAVEKIILGPNAIPSWQNQYKQDKAQHGQAYAASNIILNSVLAALAFKGAGDSVAGKVKNLPTEKTVSTSSVVPNDTARSFFNEPNPNIDPHTSSLLSKALSENKSQFTSELRAGNGVTINEVHTVPTVYGKLLNIIKGKMDKGAPLTPAESGVVKTATENPSQFVSKELVQPKQLPAETPAPGSLPPLEQPNIVSQGMAPLEAPTQPPAIEQPLPPQAITPAEAPAPQPEPAPATTSTKQEPPATISNEVSHVTPLTNLPSIIADGHIKMGSAPIEGFEGKKGVYLQKGSKNDFYHPGVDNAKIVYKDTGSIGPHEVHGDQVRTTGHLSSHPSDVHRIEVPDTKLAKTLQEHGYNAVVNKDLAASKMKGAVKHLGKKKADVKITYPEKSKLPQPIKERMPEGKETNKLTKRELENVTSTSSRLGGIGWDKTKLKELVKTVPGLKEHPVLTVHINSEGVQFQAKIGVHEFSIPAKSLGLNEERLAQADFKEGQTVDISSVLEPGANKVPVINKGKASFEGTTGGSSKPKVTEHPLDALQEKARQFSDPQKFYDSLKPVERDVVRQNYRKKDGESEIDLFKRMMESSGAKISEGKPPEDGYKMSHRPNEDGPRAHNLTESDQIPKDMYSEWYGSRGSVADKQSIAALKAIKGQPNAEVTIYRAAPTSKMRSGDWVTFSKDYATKHAESNTLAGNDLKVYQFKVPAHDVRWAMDDINEFGYYPQKNTAKFEGTSGSRRQAPKSGAKVDNIFKKRAAAKAEKTKQVNPITKFIKSTEATKKAAGSLDDQLHALGGQTIADNVALDHMFKEVQKLKIKPEDWKAIYHYAEDKASPITESQKAIYEQTIKPLQDGINTMRKEMGLKEFSNDDFIHREVIGHGGPIDRFMEGTNKTISTGNVLNRTSSSMKTRTWMKLVDGKGNSKIVSIKSPKDKKGKVLGGQQVTEFKNGMQHLMGLLKKKIPDPVTEFNDPVLMDQLNKIAEGLGLTHIRTNIPLKRGDTAAGVSYGGTGLIKTKTASAPDTLLHEIGHQIDEKYNLYDYMIDPVPKETVMATKGINKGKMITRPVKQDSAVVEERKTINQELRDLADKRLSEDSSSNMGKYVRKGEEKMAVMFQAYLHAPDIFKTVAPTAFDKFEAFLKSHADTKAITTIEKSLQFGRETIGDVRHQGEFIDKNGKKWKIVNATTKEIEANSKTRYIKQPFVTSAIDYVQTRQALRASQFLDNWKTHPNFEYKVHEDGTTSGIAIKFDSKTAIPDGWKTTTALQFKGYYFEPRVAEVLDDFAKTAAKGDPLGAFTGMNNFLRTTIFYNPLMHVPNIFWHAAMRRGVSGLINPVRLYRGVTSSVQAINEVIHTGDLYQEMLRNGAPLMHFDRDSMSKNLGKLVEDVLKDDNTASTLAKLGGYASKANFVKAWYKVSSGVTWSSHDFFMMQGIIEEMKKNGMTMDQAIHEVTAHIPDYRLPTRFFGSRTAKTTLSNHNVTMFLPYHYGIWKSYANTIREIAGFEPRGGYKRTGWSGKAKTSAHGIDKLIMAGLIMLVIYPMLDKLAQKISGVPGAIVRRAGPFTFPYAVYEMLEGNKSLASTVQTMVPTPPGTKAAIELARNRDDLNRQIWNPSDAFTNPVQAAKDVGSFVAGTIAPVSKAKQATNGKLSAKQFGEGAIGIQTPDHTKTLVNQLYSQQLNTGVQSKAQQRAAAAKNAARDQIAQGKGDSLAKQLVANGTITQAKLKAFEATAKWTPVQRTFDALSPVNKLQVLQKTSPSNWSELFTDKGALIKEAQKQSNNKHGSAANRAAAGDVVKVLNGDKSGYSFTSGTTTTNEGFLQTVSAYASAFGTSPKTAFNRILTGQRILRTENGAIIVQRMPLATSSKIRVQLGSQKASVPMQLDHIIPLEIGGSNDISNLQLIPKSQDEANNPVEDYLGKQLQAGKLNAKQAQTLMLDYKHGKITDQQVYNHK